MAWDCAEPQALPSIMKTPPTFEDADGVFHAFTSRKVAALERETSRRRLRSCRSPEILVVQFACGSMRHIPSEITRQSGKLLSVPPQRQNEGRPDPFSALLRVVS